MPTQPHFPTIPQSFFWGNALDLKGGAREFLYQTSLKQGFYFKAHLFWKPLHYLLDPDGLEHILTKNYKNYVKGLNYRSFHEMAGEGLIASSGEHWKKDRKQLQPLFRKALDDFEHTVERITRKKIDLLRRTKNSSIDIHKFFFDITYEVIRHIFISPKPYPDNVDQVYQDVEIVMNYMVARIHFPHIFLPSWLSLFLYKKIKPAIYRIDSQIYQTIKTFRQGKGDSNSLLGLICQIPDFDLQDIRDHIFTFLIAGHETTALALQHFWYVMATQQEYAKTALDEIYALNGKVATDFKEQPFTKAMLDETFRLYPPVVMIGRQNLEDDVIGGYFLPQNSLVQVPIYAIHRHPDLWEKPEKFDPSRFIDNDEKAFRYKLLPFGEGPRICIGKQLALSEIAIISSLLSQHFDWKCLQPDVTFYKSSVTLKTNEKVIFSVKAR